MTMQTFTPLEYLKIDIASNFGLDKSPWNDRIEWVDQNETVLLEIAELNQRDLKRNNLLKMADSPALFYAGIKAWDQARRGESIAYPISLDATASGAQLLAIMIGCEKSARLCNVVDTGNREDLYTNIYTAMLGRLGSEDAASIERTDAKQAVMTSLYGSKAEPKRVFGEGIQLKAFYETMSQDAPGIWDLNESLLGLWQPDALSHDWIMPDNFHVKTKTMDKHEEYVQFANAPHVVTTKVNRPTEEGRSIAANVTHSVDGMVVREVSRRCSYDPVQLENLMEILTSGARTNGKHDRPQDKLVQTLWTNYHETGFLSARILELLDQENIGLVDSQIIVDLVTTLPEKPFKVLSVHDCFRVHPNYGNDLRRQYNQVLFELAGSEILASIAGQITGGQINVQKYDDIAIDVLEANYALS